MKENYLVDTYKGTDAILGMDPFWFYTAGGFTLVIVVALVHTWWKNRK